MSADQWIWQLERVIPSSTDDCREVMDELLEQLRKQNWGDHDVFCVHLSFEEAMMNALKHGNRMDPTKTIEVSCKVSGNRLRLEITDEGEVFNPKSVPDPTDDDHLDAPSGGGLC